MPRLIWSVLCHRSIIEAETNKLSLVDIPEALYPPSEVLADIESVEPPNVVLLPLRWDHVTWWQRGETDKSDEFFVRHAIRDPMKRLLRKSMQLKAEFRGQHKVRTVLRSPFFFLRGIGTYEFAVSVSTDGKRWRKVAGIPFDVGPRPTGATGSDRVPIIRGDIQLVGNAEE